MATIKRSGRGTRGLMRLRHYVRTVLSHSAGKRASRAICLFYTCVLKSSARSWTARAIGPRIRSQGRARARARNVTAPLEMLASPPPPVILAWSKNMVSENAVSMNLTVLDSKVSRRDIKCTIIVTVHFGKCTRCKSK